MVEDTGMGWVWLCIERGLPKAVRWGEQLSTLKGGPKTMEDTRSRAGGFQKL